MYFLRPRAAIKFLLLLLEYDRMDVVFHRYYDASIKDGTRRQRGQGNKELGLAGTAKQRKYILCIHTILEHLSLDQMVLQTLLGLHALTGSDTTRYFAGHSKKTCW